MSAPRRVAGRLVAFLAVGVVALVSSAASGQSFNIDLEASPLGGAGAGVPANTFGAAANQPGAWNRVFASSPNPTPLFDITGAATNVTIGRSPVPIFHGGFNDPNTTGDFERLLDDTWRYITTADYVVDGLLPGWYEVYTYGIEPGNPVLLSEVTVPGASPLETQQCGGAMPPNGFILGRTHTLHRVLVTKGMPLVVKLRALVDGASVSGIQLKQVDPCPRVDIIDPANFDCICGSREVIGDVTIASPGSIAFWLLQFRALTDPTWTTISFGFNSGPGIFLGTINTAGLTQGFYLLKLTAYGGDGCVEEDTHIVFVDTQFDSLSITTPIMGQAYGGTICTRGIVNDQCFRSLSVQWAPQPPGVPFTDVDPLTPFYFNESFNPSVVLARWDTIAQSIPDGTFRVRATANDQCGHTASQSVDIIVDNTPPISEITSPKNCQFVSCTSVDIFGTIQDANLSNWVLQVTGGPFNNWVTIASGTGPIGPNGFIATWNTSGLPLCSYTLRLRVFDSAIIDCNRAIRQFTDHQVSVVV
ncbi:MAG: hypothetical protein ACE5FA_14350, partial [Dehalococcoidia bacterium]